jgi:N-acetylglucosamine-6-phosphate deacetylase
LENSILITGIKVYAENQIVENGFIRIREGKITEIGQSESLSIHDVNREKRYVFPQGYSLLPGFIDVHIHGAGGSDTMDATPEALDTIAKTLPKEGTTSFLATTITQSSSAIGSALANAAEYIEKYNSPGRSEILGIHLEGPFISPKRAGAQPKEHIVNPSVEVFKRWQEIAKGNIKLVTLAPEEEGGLELTSYLREKNVIASIGHSDATFQEVDEAIRAGLSHTTHLFNQMRGLHHREPGVVGAAYLREELMTELIVDGIHVSPEMINLTYQQIGKDRLLLITDSIRAKWLTNGLYDLGGQDVTVTDGKAQLKDGTLAGSMLKMNDAFKNMISYSGASIQDVIKMTSVNPAKKLGIYQSKGSISVGKDADVVVLDENLEVVLTICLGKVAYRKEGIINEGN